MNWSQLGFTSGRRTHAGNRKVRGKANSAHLRGEAADFTAPYADVRRMFPNNRILEEGNHRHVSGLSGVPYHGKNGTIGLVNGIDTSAPRGNQQAMIQPRKPISRPGGGMKRPELYPVPSYGPDPLAPMPEQGGMMQPPMAQQMMQPPMMPPQGAQAPAPPKSGGNKFGAILGILGDAMSAYGGQRGVYAPFMAQQQENEQEENQYQRRLQDQIEAKKAEREFDLANPKPIDLQQRVEYLNSIRQGQGNEYASSYAKNGGGMTFKPWTDPASGDVYNQGGGDPDSKTIVGADGRNVEYRKVDGVWMVVGSGAQ